MKKVFLLTGIVAWSILGLLILGVLFISLSGTDAPDWVKKLPGYGGIWGERNMVNIGGNVSLRHEENFSIDGIDLLTIVADYQSIAVTLTNDDKLTVSHYDYDNADPFTSDAGTGVLSIRTQRRTIINFLGFGINSHPRLEISVPRSYAGHVSLTAVSGSIRIEETVTWGNTALQTTSGSVRLNAPGTFADFSAKTTSGSVRLAGAISGDTVGISSTSGSITLANCESEGQVFLKSVSGSIRSGNIRGADVTAESTSGSQHHGSIDAGGTIRLTAVSGTVRADAVRSPTHHIRTTSGSIRIGELTGNGEVRSTSGSVRTG
jgi:hypothetical protein